MSVAYENACVCGKSFDGNNCAHYLSNWLIKNGKMEANLAGCYPCSSGRPIRAKEVRDYYFMNKFLRTLDDPGTACFIYCFNKANGKGHVYYGTKTQCIAGTGTWPHATDYEYFLEK